MVRIPDFAFRGPVIGPLVRPPWITSDIQKKNAIELSRSWTLALDAKRCAELHAAAFEDDTLRVEKQLALEPGRRR